MSRFERLIRFSSSDGKAYFAELKDGVASLPSKGCKLSAYRTFDDLINRKQQVDAVVDKILSPLPRTDLPIYCVGLNYRSHAKEAGLNIPMNPPLWTKPSTTLASPDEDIPLSRYCASNLPDWEGELVFVTSAECRDVSPAEAESYILGYTIGNDLSCRYFQMPEQNGGQFFYAKAFDKFAPIGPVLASSTVFRKGKGTKLTTRVNGQVMQDAAVNEDMVFSPAQVLSFMSQSTTIPAYTVVMSGTAAGVGAFKKPKQFLKHNDVVEVEISNLGVLRNKIICPDGQEATL